ncbi:MAG: rod shape-determining protein RodA [Pseudomonadota bacterium]
MIDRRFITNFDWLLLLVVILISTAGIINLYSAGNSADVEHNTIYTRQIYWVAISCVFMVCILSVDYRRLADWAGYIYGGMIVLLIAVYVVGKTVSGSQRWIDLGPLRFQPSEMAKLVTVIVLAAYFYRKDIKKGYGLKDLAIPTIIVLIPFVLIAKQPDLGTGLLLLCILGSMVLFVRIKMGSFLVLLGFGLTSLPFLWSVLKDYQKRRVQSFLWPETDPLGSGYQCLQSKIAVGSGKIFGKGYLEGSQSKLNFLPEQHTDFALSVFAEEWGFVGCVLLIALYFGFIFLALNIAIRSKEKFGTLLSFGIVAMIFWQLVINTCMVLGLLPVVGVPLPLISYGGSSTITTMAGVAMLLNIRMRRFMLQKGP